MRKQFKSRCLVAVLTYLLVGCAFASQANQTADEFFAKAFKQRLELSPQWQAELGIKTQYDQWDSLSKEHERRYLKLYKAQLAELKQKVNYRELDPARQLSYRLFENDTQFEIKNQKFWNYNYPVNQMFGLQAEVPGFLINTHQITDITDATAYVKRLQKIKPLFEELVDGLKMRAKQGIILPKFLFPYVINDCENVIKGQPFDNSEEQSPLWEDFNNKLAKLNLSAQQKQKLAGQAKDALLNSVGPAYRNLMVYLKELEKQANNDAGAWKFPHGKEFYQYALEQSTTTTQSAKEIHEIGLQEVRRIHGEMYALMAELGFKGSLHDFFQSLKDAKYYFANSEAGRQDYLAQTNQVLADIKAKLDLLFKIQPKSELMIKRVEAYREQSAGSAFYQPPAADNSRPGIYYVNLSDMAQMPRYELPALAYHEGVPGHHFQLAIANELTSIPDFRKHGNYTAYIEGWGLYAELLPKEIGFYQDPYADFGRLSMELMRASRLVVDTGIHAMHWTREQAIAYLDANLASSPAENIKAVERYIVMPGQATAYKIGMLKIVQLREEAHRQLGKCFDIREFHDVILKSGPLPLDVLEQQVHTWMKHQQSVKQHMGLCQELAPE